HRSRWLEYVPRHLRRLVQFSGGFVSQLNLTAKQLDKYGPGLFEHYPISAVLIHEAMSEQEASRLAVQPFWSRVRSLSIRRACGGHLRTLTLLLGSAFLVNLRHLDLAENGLAYRLGKALAGWPGLGRLDRLVLGCSDLGDYGVAALLSGEGPLALRSLDLWNTHLGNAGA